MQQSIGNYVERLKNLLWSIAISLFLFPIIGFAFENSEHPIERPITLYVNEFVLPGIGMASATRTLETIKKAISPRKLDVKIVTVDGLSEAMGDHSGDLYIAGSAVYWRHVNHGIRDIATLVTREQPDPDHAVGALILARKDDASISDIDDLKGKTIGLNHPHGFQGYYTLLKELEDRGYDSEKFFGKTIFYGLEPEKRLNALRSHKVDAIALNVCYVEREMAKGHNILEGLKTIGEKSSNETHCKTSTDLYPNWTFLISPTIDGATITKIAKALYDMSDVPDGQYWTVASDYSRADELYKTLKAGPYSYLKSWTIDRVWSEYKLPICVALFIMVLFLWDNFRIKQLVKKRTKELREALSKQQSLYQMLREMTKRFEKTRKAVIVSQLSNLVVHDLSQPLASIRFYARAQKVLLEKKEKSGDLSKIWEAVLGIFDQASKAAQIIQKVRDYASNKNEVFQPVDLKELIEKVVQSKTIQNSLNSGSIHLHFPKESVFISGSPIELELMLTNIIKNSLEAPNGNLFSMDISLNLVPKNKVELLISDNGDPLSPEEFKRMMEPLNTLKKEGLGLGLSIVQAIVEKHLGLISFYQNKERGITTNIIFTLQKQKENT